MIPHLASHVADDLTEAVIRLQHLTHEPWTVDWQRFGLVCKHGVLVSHWDVLAGSAAVLAGLMANRHAHVHRSRTQGQQRPRTQSDLPSGIGSGKTLSHWSNPSLSKYLS